MVPALAVLSFLASRLAYVFWVGKALLDEERRQRFTRDGGVEAGWRRFRRTASWIMNNDGVAFVLLCLLTRNTLSPGWPRGVTLAMAGALIATGVGIKVWAASRLGGKAYYWHNFFDPSDSLEVNPPGPYRYLKNPMYTLGYLQTYGLALLFASLPGLLLSGFAQLAILGFHRLVEAPHFEALTRRARH
jgi:protein-S-isoprenylcysteine O-methyltransferase Ste14